MKKLILFLLIAALTACTPSRISMTATITPTFSPLPDATSTNKATSVSTAMPKPTDNNSSDFNFLEDQCFDTLSNLPIGIVPSEILVLKSSNGLSLLNLTQHTQREISGLVPFSSTSPNGRWLVYAYYPPNQAVEQIAIESADGLTHIQFPVKQGWLIFDNVLWLDNERLWFSVLPDILQGQVAPVVILNPFTGEQQELLSDYPQIERYQIGMTLNPGLHFGYSSVVYHPSLDLVIYPQSEEDRRFITLWDRQSQRALVKIPDGGLYGHLPLWLPGGERFVVVARYDWDSPREWLSVSRDGDVRQLTHFGDMYADFEIGMYASISPDGNYLAFGLSENVDTNTTLPKQLIILNLQTLEAINTCVTFSYPAPIWSPNSRYVAVQTRDSSSNPSNILVLDIEQKWAAKIAEDAKAIPVGWMINKK
ncbi:MAG: TolB family protein [Chloroflexota bacterium]